jgi:tetratricopeptide (TPR) repeat protein
MAVRWVLLAWLGVVGLWAQDSQRSSLALGVELFHQAYRSWDTELFIRAEHALQQVQPTDREQEIQRWYWLGVVRFHAALCRQGKQPPPEGDEERDLSWDTTLAALDRLLSRDPHHAEGHALKATVLGLQVGNHVWRALRYGPAIQRHQRAALQWGAQNPRVLYLQGVALWKTAQSRTGREAAAEILRRADRQFQQEGSKPPAPDQPRWGHGDCLAFLGQIEECLGNWVAAEEAYRRALELHPGHRLALQGLGRLQRNF